MNYYDYSIEIELGRRIVKERRENAFREFLEEIDFHDKFFCEVKSEINKETFTIYTTHPGIWIGYKGKNLKRLKEILSKVENTMVDVEFKEIRGEFFDI